MKKKKSTAILSFLILWTTINTGILLKQTYSPSIEYVTLNTEEGAKVRQEIEPNFYGESIEGNYVIHGPKDQKYSLNSNLRPQIYINLTSSILAFIVFLRTCKDEEKTTEQKDQPNS